MHWIGREHHAKIRDLEAQLKRYLVFSELQALAKKAKPEPPTEMDIALMTELKNRFWKKEQIEHKANAEDGDKIVSMATQEDRWAWDDYVFRYFTASMPAPAIERRQYVS